MSTPAQKELNRLNKKAAYERLHSVNPDQADVVSKFGGTSYPIALVMRSYGISNFETNGHIVARKIFFEMEIGGPGSSRLSINQELLAKPLPYPSHYIPMYENLHPHSYLSVSVKREHMIEHINE